LTKKIGRQLVMRLMSTSTVSKDFSTLVHELFDGKQWSISTMSF